MPRHHSQMVSAVRLCRTGLPTLMRTSHNQRSPIELLRYQSLIGPLVVQAAKGGGCDPAVWTAAQAAYCRTRLVDAQLGKAVIDADDQGTTTGAVK